MLKAQLAVEFYRNFQHVMPDRLRMRLKAYIDKDQDVWKKLGERSRILDETNYQLELDMRHWHQRWTYIKGYYPEPHITSLLKRVLAPDFYFIDIGANIGIHSLFAASKLEQHERIWSIEPNPKSFARLQAHLKINQLTEIQAQQIALGNENKLIRLAGCDDAHVGSSLRHATENGCEVSMMRGDEVFASIPDNANGLCKIDVEGFELEVLRGMENFIASHPNFSYIVEVTPQWLESLNGSAQMLFDCFLQQGFQAYEVKMPYGTLLPLLQSSGNEQYDAFFSKAVHPTS